MQQAIFDAYAAEIAQKQPALSKEQIFEETRKFVFPPGSDALFPPLHATGGAVDLTIVDEQGRELDMGTASTILATPLSRNTTRLPAEMSASARTAVCSIFP